MGLIEIYKGFSASFERGDLQQCDLLIAQLRTEYPENTEAARMQAALDLEKSKNPQSFEKYIVVLQGFSPSFWHFRVAALALNKLRNALPDQACTDYFSLVISSIKSNLLTDQGLLVLIDTAGFSSCPDFFHADRIFEKLIIPALQILAEQGRFELLLELERRLYKDYIRFRENEAHFGYAYGVLKPIYRDAGHKFGEAHFPRKQTFQRPQPAKHRVAFFIHQASMLAHIEALLSMLRGYMAQAEKPIEPTIICFGGHDQTLDRHCHDLGVSIFFLSHAHPDATSVTQRLILAHKFIDDHQIRALVFVSSALWLPFIFSARIAPVQIWWAMKYQTLHLPEIDGCIAVGSVTGSRKIHGQVWRTVVYGDTEWFDATLTVPALKIKAGFGAGKVVLGSYGREEKLRDQRFLETVKVILSRHPDCIFLWTGKNKDPEIEEFFLNSGVHHQTHFIGWVDTRLYAQVLDIFLDSFPFPAGFTVIQAMAASVPNVFMRVPEANLGVQMAISPIYFGMQGSIAEQQRVAEIFLKDADKPLYLLSNSTNDYCDNASQLISDTDFRARVGVAGKIFVNEFLSKSAELGAGFAQHLIEIIEQSETSHELLRTT